MQSSYRPFLVYNIRSVNDPIGVHDTVHDGRVD